jgi:hypothetical protein
VKTLFHGAMGRGKKSYKLVWGCHQLLSVFLANGKFSPEIFLLKLNATGRMMMQLPFDRASTRSPMWRKNILTARKILKIFQFEIRYQIYIVN